MRSEANEETLFSVRLVVACDGWFNGMTRKKASNGPRGIDFARKKTYAALSLIAIAYMTMLCVLTLFSLAGFSFKPPRVNLLLDIVSLAFIVPTLLALYLNREKVWATISLMGLPILLLAAPVPYELALKFTIFLAAAGCLFLPSVKHRQKRLISIPVGVIAFFLAITWPFWMFVFVLSVGTHKVHISVSPDRKYLVEVSGDATGEPLSGDTKVDLYRNYPGSVIRRFERNIISSGSWPAEVEIKWVDNETIEILGTRFNIGASSKKQL